MWSFFDYLRACRNLFCCCNLCNGIRGSVDAGRCVFLHWLIAVLGLALNASIRNRRYVYSTPDSNKFSISEAAAALPSEVILRESAHRKIAFQWPGKLRISFGFRIRDFRGKWLIQHCAAACNRAVMAWRTTAVSFVRSRTRALSPDYL